MRSIATWIVVPVVAGLALTAASGALAQTENRVISAPADTYSWRDAASDRTPATQAESDYLRAENRRHLAGARMAHLALRKAGSEDVKLYAYNALRAHSTARQELRDIANRKNVRLDEDMTAEQRRAMAELQNLNGRDFDRWYMRHVVHENNLQMDNLRDSQSQASSTGVRAYWNRNHVSGARLQRMGHDIAGENGLHPKPVRERTRSHWNQFSESSIHQRHGMTQTSSRSR